MSMPNFDDVLALAHRIDLFDRGIDPESSRQSALSWVERFSKTPLVSNALRLGFDAHASVKHMRKYQPDLPYFVHPMAVAIYVARLLDSAAISQADKNKMIAAALLHDVLEDTKTGTDAIESAVGPDVLSLVKALTDEYTKEAYPELNRAARKERELARTLEIEPRAVLVKLCDSWHNLQDIARHDKSFSTLYVREKKLLIDGFVAKSEGNAYPGPLGDVIYSELLRQKSRLSNTIESY